MKNLIINISCLISCLIALFFPRIDVVVNETRGDKELLPTPLVSQTGDPSPDSPFSIEHLDLRDSPSERALPIDVTTDESEKILCTDDREKMICVLPKTERLDLPEPYSSEIQRSIGILSFKLEKKYFHFITDPTDSFKQVVDIARKKKNSILVDRHFNAGGGFGYLTIPNPQAMNFAELLNEEYEKIYKAKNWQRSSYNMDVSLTEKFQILSYAARYGQASVIDEFGFIDDSRNGSAVIEWMKSQEGQDEIAKATIRASLKSSFDHIFLSAGHWGPRGTVGASHKGFHETDYSFAVFSSMATALKQNDTASNLFGNKTEKPRWGYTEDKTEKKSVDDQKSHCKL